MEEVFRDGQRGKIRDTDYGQEKEEEEEKIALLYSVLTFVLLSLPPLSTANELSFD